MTLPPDDLAALTVEYARLHASCERVENLLTRLVAVLEHRERPPPPPTGGPLPLH